MRFSDIALAQPSLRSCMCSLSLQASSNDKVLGTNFIHGYCKRFASTWQSLENYRMVRVNTRTVEWKRIGFRIKAVATLQPRSSAQSKDESKNYEEVSSNISHQEASSTDAYDDLEEVEEPDEREKLRRLRISKANKGLIPWNKGRKHSPETIQKIKERTWLAMQNPKVKMKLANLGHAQSKETRQKIGIGVQMKWKRRRAKQLVQEGCFLSWQNMVAEAARLGFDDEEVHQWDSFEILKEQLGQEWLEVREERRLNPRQRGNKRAPKPFEQRRKIAEAIAAKWADPNYRERVCSGIAKYHGIPDGGERKRRRPSREGQSTKRSPKREVRSDVLGLLLTETKPKPPKRKGPKYKDPLAKAKLVMIKNIRAQRVASISQRNEALERAKRMIAEAEKAAKALEVAATRSPVARASLLESRKLIAEAVRSIESIESREGPTSSEVDRLTDSINKGPTSSDVDRLTGIEYGGILETGPGTTAANPSDLPPQLKVNGFHASIESSGRDENMHSLAMPSSEPCNGFGGEQQLPMMSGYEVPRYELESLMEKLDFEDLLDQEVGLNGGSIRDSSDLKGQELESNGVLIKDDLSNNQEVGSNGAFMKDLKDQTDQKSESNGAFMKDSKDQTDEECESNGSSIKDSRDVTDQEIESNEKSNEVVNKLMGEPRRNGVRMQELGRDEGAPLKAVTKRWVRGRLVEVVGE